MIDACNNRSVHQSLALLQLAGHVIGQTRSIRQSPVQQIERMLRFVSTKQVTTKVTGIKRAFIMYATSTLKKAGSHDK